MQLVRHVVHVTGDLAGLCGAMAKACPRPVRVDLEGQLIELDAQRRDSLTDVVVQLSRDPLPLDFLAGNQPPGQVAIELRRPLQLGDVAHNGEEAVGTGLHDARLEAPRFAHRQVVLDHHRVVAPTGIIERLHHHVGERRRHDITHIAADEFAGGTNSKLGSRAW